jgi:hypothetical protein
MGLVLARGGSAVAVVWPADEDAGIASPGHRSSTMLRDSAMIHKESNVTNKQSTRPRTPGTSNAIWIPDVSSASNNGKGQGSAQFESPLGTYGSKQDKVKLSSAVRLLGGSQHCIATDCPSAYV